MPANLRPLRKRRSCDRCPHPAFSGYVLAHIFMTLSAVRTAPLVRAMLIFSWMPDPSKDMPREDRKRHYAAIGRMCKLDPTLANNFSLLKTSADKFQFLKETLLSGTNKADVTLAESTVTERSSTNTDRYRRVTKFQLQQTYGSSPAALLFIEKLCEGQEGQYHPQAVGYSPGKTYRVLKDVAENVGTAMKNQTKVRLQ